MSFDPSTIAAQTAALTARADQQQFSITTASTPLYGAGHPYQASFATAVTAGNIAVSISAVYRGQTVAIPQLIAQALDQPRAQAAALDYAAKVFDLLDQKASANATNPNPWAPGGTGWSK